MSDNSQQLERMWGPTPPLPEQRGAFASEYDRLYDLFMTNTGVLGKEEINGEKVLLAPVCKFSYSITNDVPRRSTTDGEVSGYITAPRRVFGVRDSSITLAIDPHSRLQDSSPIHLKLSSDGIVVNIDTPNIDFGTTEQEKEILRSATDQLGNELSDLHRQERDKSDHRKRIIKKTGALLVTGFLISGGTALAFKRFYLDPKYEAFAQRVIYDNQHHSLPGKAEAISSKVTTMPASQFNIIPAMADGDSLQSPRTIDVLGNKCSEVDVSIAPGAEIVSALAEGDALDGSSIVVVANGSDKLEVCMFGQDSPGSNHTESSKLALQFVPGNTADVS